MLALATQAEREIGARLHQIGPQPDGGPQRGLRLGVSAAPAERDAELVVKVGVRRPQHERPPEGHGGPGVVAEGAEGQPLAGVEVGVVGIDALGVRVHLRLLRPLAQPAKRRRQADVGVQIGGAQAERLAERDRRLVVSAQSVQRHGQMLVSPERRRD